MFFVRDLARTGSSAENAFRNHKPSKRSITGRHLPQEDNNMTLFFLNEPLPGDQRHVCTKFGANLLRTDCVGPILSQT